MDMRTLTRLARNHSHRWVPLQTRQSYPIPIRRGDRRLVSFLYGTQYANPKVGIELMPPHLLISFDAASGDVQDVTPFNPRDIAKLPDVPGFIGAITLPPGVTIQEFRTMEFALCEAYDHVLPDFWEQNAAERTVKERVANFAELFENLYEQPLLPYYQAYGHEFFTWLQSFGASPFR